jgi:hypothetical protein
MHGLVRPRRAVPTPDRFKIEVLVTLRDFEPHAACPISIEDQDTVSEDAVNQVGGRSDPAFSTRPSLVVRARSG